jgi:hypothetical protein
MFANDDTRRLGQCLRALEAEHLKRERDAKRK